MIQQKITAYENARNYTLLNKSPMRLKYAIAKGNNSNILRKCMLLRNERWEETNSFDKLYNFKWQPISRGIVFDQINSFGTRQVINHIESHPQLTTKDRLFENLVALCEQRKLDVFKIVPITFMLQFDSCFVSNELEKFLHYFNTIAKSTDVDEVNAKCGSLTLPVLPKLIERIKGSNQSSKFVMPKSHSLGHNFWILKCTGFNRGIGIHVLNKIEDLKKLMDEYTAALPLSEQLHRCRKLLSAQEKEHNLELKEQPLNSQF